MTTFRNVDGPPDPSLPNIYGGATFSTPDAGGPVHTIGPSDELYWPSTRSHAEAGYPARVTVGESFGSGIQLATDGQGRAVVAQTGDIIVAKSLESASGQGDTVWVVLEPQREK